MFKFTYLLKILDFLIISIKFSLKPAKQVERHRINIEQNPIINNQPLERPINNPAFLLGNPLKPPSFFNILETHNILQRERDRERVPVLINILQVFLYTINTLRFGRTKLYNKYHSLRGLIWERARQAQSFLHLFKSCGEASSLLSSFSSRAVEPTF